MNHTLRVRLLQFTIVGAIIAVGVFVFVRAQGATGPTAVEATRPVRVVTPELRDLERTLQLRAFVEAENTVTVLPLVSGTILAMPREVGEAVSAGDPIATIDPARYELALQQAEAAYRGAQSTWERTQQLFEANATSPQNLDQARAQLDATRSQRNLAQLQLGYTTVTSPVSGVVMQRHLSPGDIASSERPVITVGDVERIRVRAAVPEEWYPHFVTNPEGLSVRLQMGEFQFPGEIRTVAPVISPQTRTFEVVAVVADRDVPLRPGMSVTVVFGFETRRAVPTIPLSAVGYQDTLWYVEDQHARSMEAPRIFRDNRYLQLPEEYTDRQFIVEGQHFLSPGQPVMVLGGR